MFYKLPAARFSIKIILKTSKVLKIIKKYKNFIFLQFYKIKNKINFFTEDSKFFSKNAQNFIKTFKNHHRFPKSPKQDK